MTSSTSRLKKSKGENDKHTSANSDLRLEGSLSGDYEERERCTYKHQIIQQEMNYCTELTSGYDSVIEKLRDLGITLYLIKHDSLDIFEDLFRIVEDATTESWVEPQKSRCCLFKDEEGRVFNVVISGGSSGIASLWDSLLVTFSGLEATVAITVLSRFFACASQSGELGARPAYISLILGLVLTEEISLCLLNVTILVKGCPSVGAYVLTSSFSSDWLRKLIVFSLALAGAVIGSAQKILTIFGVSLACVVLAANLGARSWKNLQVHTLDYSGPFGSIIAFILAVFAGICVPYLGYREVEVGGNRGLQNLIKSAFFVAVFFMASDIDKIQTVLLFGSQECAQNAVNVVVGLWWTFSLIASLMFHSRLPVRTAADEYEEPFLVRDQASPVGYVVPGIPKFTLDPANSSKTFLLNNSASLLLFGGTMALLIGFLIIFMGLHPSEMQIFFCNKIGSFFCDVHSSN